MLSKLLDEPYWDELDKCLDYLELNGEWFYTKGLPPIHYFFIILSLELRLVKDNENWSTTDFNQKLLQRLQNEKIPEKETFLFKNMRKNDKFYFEIRHALLAAMAQKKALLGLPYDGILERLDTNLASLWAEVKDVIK